MGSLSIRWYSIDDMHVKNVDQKFAWVHLMTHIIPLLCMLRPAINQSHNSDSSHLDPSRLWWIKIKCAHLTTLPLPCNAIWLISYSFFSAPNITGRRQLEFRITRCVLAQYDHDGRHPQRTWPANNSRLTVRRMPWSRALIFYRCCYRRFRSCIRQWLSLLTRRRHT